MLRLTGIFIGSALAVGLLLITLGRPRLAAPDPESEALSPPPASIDRMVGAQTTDPEPTPAPETPNPNPNQPIGPESPQPGSEIAKPPAPEPEMAAIEQLFAPEASRTLVLPEATEKVVEEHWYAFWSPFRSEIAANGFIARLQESTGIDYRVVKVKTGVYEVAFAYTDETDIETKLERIATATGLDMSGG